MKRFRTALLFSALIFAAPMSASAVCLIAVDCALVLGLGAAILGGGLATQNRELRPMHIQANAEEMRRVVAQVDEREGRDFWIRNVRFTEPGVANFANIISAHQRGQYEGGRGTFTVQYYFDFNPAIRTHLRRWRANVAEALGEERAQAAYGQVPSPDASWAVQGPFWGKLAEDAQAIWENKFYL